jgi:phage/plasmid-associated DNA primase
MTTQPLPLGLEKKTSVLDGIVLFEKINEKRLKALIKSDKLLMNEKINLTKYLKKYDKKHGGIEVKYVKPKHKWGRSFPTKSLGLSTFRRIVRNTLICEDYYDFDVKNCQPNIIRNLCESNNIPCPMIKRYCLERDEVLRKTMEHYNVDRDKAKELFIRMCFYGTFYGWAKDNNIEIPATEFIVLFERELQDIASKIKADKGNTGLYETARKKKQTTENKTMGSFFGLYNQEYETRIFETLMCYLINNTKLMKMEEFDKPVGTYEYDGIKLLKENVDKYDGGKEAVLKLLIDKTEELTKFKLDWDIKEIEPVIDITAELEQVEEDDKPDEDLLKITDDIWKKLNRADVGIVETIMEIYPKHFVYSVEKNDGTKGDWYGWNSTRWEKSDAPLRKALIYDIDKHFNGLLQPFTDIYKDYKPKEGEEPDYNWKIWQDCKAKVDDTVWRLRTSAGIQAVVTVAKTLLADYLLEFDTKEDLFGCENGVIDIENETFRPYRFDDYMTWSCGYDYRCFVKGMKVIEAKDQADLAKLEAKMQAMVIEIEKLNTKSKLTVKQEEKLQRLEEELELIDNQITQLRKKYADGNEKIITDEDVEGRDLMVLNDLSNIYEQIMPDEEVRDYFYKIIATGMSGRAIEKFFVFNGGGRNGKGLTNEFLEKVLGDYFVTVNPIVYSEDNKKKTSSGANPEVANMDKKRYIVSKEPDKNNPFNNNVIKDFTGGGQTKARMLYSSKTKVTLCGTFVVECNAKPDFSENPTEADTERIDDILFPAFFTAKRDEWDETTGETNHIFKLDPDLKPRLKKDKGYWNAMLNVMLMHLLILKKDNYNIANFRPQSVTERSLTYLQNSYDINNIFTRLFEKRNEANKDKYKNSKGEPSDKDWSLNKIAMEIKKSNEFYDLPKKKQKEYKVKDAIEGFFRKNNVFKKSVYTDTHDHTQRLEGWRLIPEEEDAGQE